MQNTDIPLKLPLPFGASAAGDFIRAIPVASQISTTPGAASLTDGFPPLNAQPIASGGVPPNIKDMNGILFEISGWARWVAAGGPIYFDGAFAAAIGGYPYGAILQSATTAGLLYVSTAQNNTTDPDAAGAVGWVGLVSVPATLAELIAGTNTAKFATAATLAALRATTADIIAGIDPARYMSPAAFYGARASGADVAAGTDDHKYVTPLGMSAANSNGIIRFPGGLIMQYGHTFGYAPEGTYTTPFNTPFLTAVDTVTLTPVKNNGSVGPDADIYCHWRQSSTSLSTLAYTINYGTGSGAFLDGISWIAFGR
jgi:hypothetical protein